MTFRNGAQRASLPSIVQRLIQTILLVAILGTLTTAIAGPVTAASAPKVAIIVGPSGPQTATFRNWANAAATEALRYTPNVVKVYSPRATWSRVKWAISGASIVIYLGRGRGFPSPYSSILRPSSEDGFGLNPTYNGNNSTTRYYGETYVGAVRLAPKAVVILDHLAYASGNSEPGRPQPTRSVARRRVDNYGAGFLAAGASVVIAEAAYPPLYYVRAMFRQNVSLYSIWRSAPTFHGHVTAVSSQRTPGALVRTDPIHTTSGFTRSIVGWASTLTTTARRASSPTPSPIPVPATGSTVYGPGINADSLANTQVGGSRCSCANVMSAYRFRASTSSKLNSIRIYLVDGSGYAGGTGGTMEISVRPDDGSANHAPAATVLASTTIRPGNPISIGYLPLIPFPSPASLTAGQLYHVVFRNIDPYPTVNYVSVDGVFMYQPTVPRQAAFGDVDWGQPLRYGSGSWTDRSNTVPIMQLNYANGLTDGLGYMEVWVRSYKSISGNGMAREAFTVSGPNRAANSFSVRLMRISGSSPLIVRLETSGGSLIEQGSIAASEIAIGTPGDHGGTGHATWETYTFDKPRTLVSGQSYNVVLSTASDTVYSIFVIREGSSYSFSPTTFFSDGHAQYTIGSAWGPFTQDGAGPLDQGDLQCYFR